MLSQMAKFPHFYDEYSIAYLLHIFNAHNILCKILSFHRWYSRQMHTVFIVGSRPHTISLIMKMKWWRKKNRRKRMRMRTSKRKTWKRRWQQQLKIFAVNTFSYEPKPKKQKIVIKHYSSSLKKKKANCLIQIYVTL